MFKSSYIIIYNDMEAKLKEISEQLKGCEDLRTYLIKLFGVFKNLRFNDVVKIVKVNFKLKFTNIKRATYELKYWSIAITDAVNVTQQFTEAHYRAQHAFINKINYDSAMQYSIERYNQRLSDNRSRMVEVESEGENENSQNKSQDNEFDFGINDQIKEDSNLSVLNMKSSMKKRSKLVKLESEAISEGKRQRATEIIKKLFVRTFNPGDDPKTRSKVKQRWIDVINKYMRKKNLMVDTFVDTHIEKLPNEFSKKLFFGDDIQISKNNKNELISTHSNNGEERSMRVQRNDNSSYHSSTSRKSQDIVHVVKNQIKSTQSNKQKRLKIVIYGLFLILLIWLMNSILPMTYYLDGNVTITNPTYTHDIRRVQNVINTLMTTQVYLIKTYLDNFNPSADGKSEKESGSSADSTANSEEENESIGENKEDLGNGSGIYKSGLIGTKNSYLNGIADTEANKDLLYVLRQNSVNAIEELVAHDQIRTVDANDSLHYHLQEPVEFIINGTETKMTLNALFKLMRIEILNSNLFSHNNIFTSMLEVNKDRFMTLMQGFEKFFEDVFRSNTRKTIALTNYTTAIL